MQQEVLINNNNKTTTQTTTQTTTTAAVIIFFHHHHYYTLHVNFFGTIIIKAMPRMGEREKMPSSLCPAALAHATES